MRKELRLGVLAVVVVSVLAFSLSASAATFNLGAGKLDLSGDVVLSSGLESWQVLSFTPSLVVEGGFEMPLAEGLSVHADGSVVVAPSDSPAFSLDVYAALSPLKRVTVTVGAKEKFYYNTFSLAGLDPYATVKFNLF